MNVSDYILYRQRLVVARRRLKLRQEDVADSVYLDRKTITGLESGKREPSSELKLLRFLTDRGLNANWILTGRGPETITDCVYRQAEINQTSTDHKKPAVSSTDGHIPKKAVKE